MSKIDKQAGYYVGQIVEAEDRRDIEGEMMIEPLWFAFTTPPQKETAAKVWLERRGVECWFPTEKRWRNRPRAKITRVAYQARVVPRYVFARFYGFPHWHILRTCRWISGVIGQADKPLAVTDETLAQMAQVPVRLTYLRDQAIAREKERKRLEDERRTIRPGDKVTIKGGAFEGWIVDVSEVHEGIASFIVPLLGDSVTRVSTDRLEKVAR